jgi:hypothetical protein
MGCKIMDLLIRPPLQFGNHVQKRVYDRIRDNPRELVLRGNKQRQIEEEKNQQTRQKSKTDKQG